MPLTTPQREKFEEGLGKTLKSNLKRVAKPLALGALIGPWAAYRTGQGIYETAKKIPKAMSGQLSDEEMAQTAFDVAGAFTGGGLGNPVRSATPAIGKLPALVKTTNQVMEIIRRTKDPATRAGLERRAAELISTMIQSPKELSYYLSKEPQLHRKLKYAGEYHPITKEIDLLFEPWTDAGHSWLHEGAHAWQYEAGNPIAKHLLDIDSRTKLYFNELYKDVPKSVIIPRTGKVATPAQYKYLLSPHEVHADIVANVFRPTKYRKDKLGRLIKGEVATPENIRKAITRNIQYAIDPLYQRMSHQVAKGKLGEADLDWILKGPPDAGWMNVVLERARK